MRTIVSFLVILLLLDTAYGQKVEPITADWNCGGTMRYLRVRSVAASSTVDPSNDRYVARNGCDNDRHTKWAALERPSASSPQWLEMHLSGEQKISAVAVFGEKVGNDGIVDAQIQVSSAKGAWQTVAAITNAPSAAWLATFPTRNASAIRLLITRSSGPSPHTDVYEVEAYGPVLSAAQLEAYARARLTQAKQLETQWITQSNGQPNAAWIGSLRNEQNRLSAELKQTEKQLAKWETLSIGEKQKLADRVDQSLAEITLSNDAAMPWLDALNDKLTALQKAKDIFKGAEMATAEQRSNGRIQLSNARALLWCAEDGSAWSACWHGAADAAIFNATFDVEAAGRHFPPVDVQTHATSFAAPSGRGRQVVQTWGQGIQIERIIRLYDSGAITVSGRIKNNTERVIGLSIVRPVIIDSANRGGWFNGDVSHVPAAVYLVGASEWQCSPGRTVRWSSKDVANYSSTQVMHLADAETRRGLTVAFLSAAVAKPELTAEFRAGTGGASLAAQQNFLGRQLKPGEALSFDPVYLRADDDAYAGMEKYADVASLFAEQPTRKGATALWCSWYAHRMAVDEDLVLANAEVAAKYFKPLGFEIMQLDHGWQTGDITGDWRVDPKAFPHGFKWLSDQLQSRYGLKLGVWIAPTDVAETSDTFRQHPDWMLKDGQGKPLVNWRWYWKPNPNCFELDASNPNAATWIEDVFRRLSGDGVSYYKIDFIASSGGEQFVQQDSSVTRGWSVLRQAMESVRMGAGTNAWIRYCQPPPLLSAGLADSAYGGDDTLDAGLNGDIHVLRSNARSLAASFWLNDRLYHREVCDMSVRMQADIEEVRLRLALMTLADCSISFSDELRYLPLSRIRMMQACLPPGNPAMKPLDLFDRAIPSIWAIHCKNDADEWDVVGLFNFENTPESRTVDFTRLNLPADADIAAFEFWEQKFGIHKTNMTVTLPPQSSRIFALRRISKQPQVVGTDLHLLQGQHELKKLSWDGNALRLAGECERAAGIEGKLFIHVPSGFTPHFDFPLNEKSARLTHISGSLWAYEMRFSEARASWEIPFDRK